MVSLNKKSLLLCVSLLLSTFYFAQPAQATTVIMPADDDMIVGARAIVRARVLNVEAASSDYDGRIYTYVTLRVRETLKGEVSGRRIVIKELGGVLADRAFTVFGAPRFAPGEEVLLYLDTWADGSLRVYQMFLGKFDVVRDPASGRDFVVRSSPDEQTTVLAAAAHRHDDAPSGATTNRMELDAYRRMVGERLAANRAASEAFAAAHYADVSQFDRPPDYLTAGARRSLRPQFSLLGPARWFEPDTGLPVPFKINPDGAPTPQTVQDVEAAMAAWSNQPGSALQVVNAGTINFCYVGTGTSAIIFNNCDGRNSPTSRCASVLAWGGLGWIPSQTKTINGTLFRRATEGFVSFNPYASCHFSDHCNVQEIATHELGHALGLGHSQFGDATMAAFAHFDGRCASIREDDLAAIVFVYPGEAGGGGTPLAVSTSSLAAATVGSFYAQSLQASGGTPPYSWGLAPGSAPLPGGLAISPGGQLSGTPAEGGSFNFTVQVTDSRSNFATRTLSLTVASQSTQYDAEFVSQTVPTTLTPGQTFSVTMSWRNTGTQTWTASSGFVLRSQNPPNNQTWGGNTVQFAPFSVAPGGTLNATFNALAPTTPGTYNFQWQPYREGTGFFGQMSQNVVIQVEAPAVEDAAFVAQETPEVVNPGQQAQVKITMRNAGNTTWSPNTHALVPAAQSVSWGVSQVDLPGPVAAGQSVTFTFTINAPEAPGAYGFQWRMAKNGTPFGAATPATSIQVAGADDAEFIGQSVPLTLNRGQVVQVSVTMRNSGSKTWTQAAGYALATQNPIWSVQRVDLPAAVAPGETVTFTFNVMAPAAAGLYSFQWRMMNGVFFGDSTTHLEVTVTQSLSTDPLTILTPKKLPQGRLDETYMYQLSALGGALPYRWALLSGRLPDGLFLDGVTGRITGVPSRAKAFKFKVVITDPRGATKTKKFKLVINR